MTSKLDTLRARRKSWAETTIGWLQSAKPGVLAELDALIAAEEAAR
jgi:hypothetical protein